MWSKSHLPSEVRGTVYDKLMHSTDWVPTLASLAGAELKGRCVARNVPSDKISICLALVVGVASSGGIGTRARGLKVFSTLAWFWGAICGLR